MRLSVRTITGFRFTLTPQKRYRVTASPLLFVTYPPVNVFGCSAGVIHSPSCLIFLRGRSRCSGLSGARSLHTNESGSWGRLRRLKSFLCGGHAPFFFPVIMLLNLYGQLPHKMHTSFNARLSVSPATLRRASRSSLHHALGGLSPVGM